MNNKCDECEQNSRQKLAVKLTRCIFAVRFKKFLLVLYKEIENQPKTCRKFWLGIIRPVALHSRKKTGKDNQKRVVTLTLRKRRGRKRSLKVGKQQQTILGLN
jgi:hypothetical protein